MTEVEQARKHLLQAQRNLFMSRQYNSRKLPTHTANVLAAISWLWDAQERESLKPIKIFGYETCGKCGWMRQVGRF